jgi:hypothetical protein
MYRPATTTFKNENGEFTGYSVVSDEHAFSFQFRENRDAALKIMNDPTDVRGILAKVMLTPDDPEAVVSREFEDEV